MVILLELKEKLRKFYGKYDVYIIHAAKFLISLLAMVIINNSIGYMSRLKNPLVLLLVSVLSACLPNGFTVVALSAVIVVHLYAVSAELAVVTICLFVLMYLLYFRFTPRSGYILILTAILCWLRLPYLVPIAVGLTSGILSVIPAGFGIMVFYIIKTASEFQTAITAETSTNSVEKFSFIISSLLNNKEMLLFIAAISVAIIIVYLIRKRSFENAWSYAVVIGAVTQFIVLIMGKLLWAVKLDLIYVIVGTIVSIILGYILQILFFSVDYKRTEYVQYEDDDYYYFVKAVPKVNITDQDVKVKKINAHKVRKTNDIKGDRRNEAKKVVGKSDDEFNSEDDTITFDR